MTSIFDENGELIINSVAINTDEAKLLREKAQKVDELSKQLQEKEEVLKKHETKEINFAAYRASTQEEQAKQRATWSAELRASFDDIEVLRNQMTVRDQKELEEKRTRLLAQYAGSDEELRKKIEVAEKDLNPSLSIEKRMENAFTIATGSRPQVNPLHAYYPSSDQTVYTEKKERFTDTVDGKALLQQKFAKVIEQAKKKNPNLNI